MEALKKINFKEQRYVIPLFALPIIFFLGYQFIGLMNNKEEKIQEELATGLGDTNEKILPKNEAYDVYYGNDRERRSMLDGLGKDSDSLMSYGDNLTDKEKRKIDSLEYLRKQLEKKENYSAQKNNYYQPNIENDRDYQRSADIIRMLNEEATGNSSKQKISNHSTKDEVQEEPNPIKMMREQMLMLDSLEKSRDPELQAQLKAEERLKKNQQRMEAFLNNTLSVSKAGLNPHFNSISKEKESNFVRAVIDEDVTGYLGSRIRIRLLEDIFVGKNRVAKGTILYGQISGFSLQRVNLNIVSILNNGEILPINLSIYDVDGMQGLYVPASAFREMMRELGQNSVQGTTMDNSGQGFFTSLLSRAFQSTSQTIANLIRKNKTKIKYNSHIYLINEKELKQYENN